MGATIYRREVRVLNNLPDKFLIGRRFWRQQGLRLDLESNQGSIKAEEDRRSGVIGRGVSTPTPEQVNRVVEDRDIDEYLMKEIEYSEFSADTGMQQKLRALLWEKRGIFKGFGKIAGVQHKIALKEDAKPVFQPLRRRSPKEEDVHIVPWNVRPCRNFCSWVFWSRLYLPGHPTMCLSGKGRRHPRCFGLPVTQHCHCHGLVSHGGHAACARLARE